MFFIFLLLQMLANCSLNVPSYAAKEKTRSLILKDSQTGEINVALGYSTVLLFDCKPSSVVLGDQDAFKLEYVGPSVTLKPLISKAQSNLFVFCEYEQFNFQLKTTAPNAADFLVKIKRQSHSAIKASSHKILSAVMVEKKVKPKLTAVLNQRSAKCQNIELIIQKVGIVQAEQEIANAQKIEIAFILNNFGNEVFTFKHSDFVLQQKNRKAKIARLITEGFWIRPGKSVVVEISAITSAVNKKFQIELKNSIFSNPASTCQSLKLSFEMMGVSKQP